MTAPVEPHRASKTAVATPRVEAGTSLAADEALRARWEEALLATSVDPALWAGAFATNVWGGRYEMDGVLGAGGQGATFAGTDRKTGARVAVKVLDLKHAADWKRVELFEREVRVLKTIEHDGMPAFVDLIEDHDTGARALVMTLVPGDSLERVVARDGPLGEAQLWRVLLDVAEVLTALHGQSAPVVHRDIKPRNLVRRADGRICLVDFGGVGHRGDGGSTVVGTFGYMAPEQLYGKSTPATDVYSLGATLIALATGKEPEDLPRAGLALDVDRAAPHLSPPLRTLLTRMLSPDPAARPAGARELQQQILDVANGAQAQAHAGEPAHEPVRAREADVDLVENMQLVAAIVRLVVGVLGTVGVVIIGEILLPIVLAVMSAFASPGAKARVEHAKKVVAGASRIAKKGFSDTAAEGAKALELRSERDRERRRRKKVPKRNRRRGG